MDEGGIVKDGGGSHEDPFGYQEFTILVTSRGERVMVDLVSHWLRRHCLFLSLDTLLLMFGLVLLQEAFLD